MSLMPILDKEVDTQEFVTFLKHYLNLKDNQLFEDWLQLDKDKLNEKENTVIL
ncbi:hypothetical protein [Bacillus manliponensis]|uniref:hypothetical protein n=1 Tax=Bacillus manliponensis TaxID=574376 RepID=UPI0035164069